MPHPGLPGLRRLDHLGFTVPDLDEADRFLVEVLGCEYLYSLGPFRHDVDSGDPDWMTTHLNIHPRAEMVENRWYRCGDQAVFEVFHYRSPDQRDAVPRNSDIGGHHVALYVDDLDAAVEHLRAHGVRVLAGPTASSGPAQGNRWIYFLAPWGMQFELVSYPGGKAWDREHAAVAAPRQRSTDA
ncbi:VOC family protein [Nocardioides sp. DS6]|uniref:VOC family protein n=1 Tax=Nocardioides eburneus TaxID=3231482 RepID=A0ABV3SSR5_9ACTN